MLTFGMYEVYKSKLLAAYPLVAPGLIHFLSAVLGDVTGSFWLCPSEVVKQQIQGGMHKSTLSALDSILRTSGVAGLYRGYFGQIMRDIPFRAVQLTSYEAVKAWYVHSFATEGESVRTLR
jgi:solute carrier family 25 S-adenosylmethionine transporter 26